MLSLVLLLASCFLTLPSFTSTTTVLRALPSRLLREEHRKLIWRSVRSLRSAGRSVATWSLSPTGKATFAGFAAGLMVVSAVISAPAIDQVNHGKHHGPMIGAFPGPSGTPFFPYLIPGTDYPAPMNLTFQGQAAFPQLQTTTVAGVPYLHLLVILTSHGVSRPVILSGTYSETLAREIQEGSSCDPTSIHGHNGHGGGKNGSSVPCGPVPMALVWGAPHNLTTPSGNATLGGASTGDAFVEIGGLWAAAASSGGSVQVWVSRNSGVSWSLASAIPGSTPYLASDGSDVMVAGLLSGTASIQLETPAKGLFNSSLAGPFNSIAPVLLPPNGTSRFPTMGLLAVGVNGSVTFSRSIDGGASWTSATVGYAPFASTSPIFDRVGGTDTAAPGGTPGEVAAVASGNTTVGVFTASISGRMVPVTVQSADQGSTWAGPYASGPSMGSVASPALTLTPAGYVYGSWRESVGNGELGIQPFGIDGRALANDQTVTPSGLVPPAAPIAFTVDTLERPFLAWVSANSSVVDVAGGLLHAGQAASLLLDALENLVPGDFVNDTNSSQPSLIHKAVALAHMVTVQGDSTGAILKVEQDLYPRISSLPLVLGCTGPVPVCGHLYRGNASSYVANETGPRAANTYLAIYAQWVLAALGVLSLVPNPSDATAIGSWTYTHCASGCASNTGTIVFQAVAQVTDPETAWVNLTTAIQPVTVMDPTLETCTSGSGTTTSVMQAQYTATYQSVSFYGAVVHGRSVTSYSQINGTFFGEGTLNVSIEGLAPDSVNDMTWSSGFGSPFSTFFSFPSVVETDPSGCSDDPSQNTDFDGLNQTIPAPTISPLPLDTRQLPKPLPPEIVEPSCPGCSSISVIVNGSSNVPSAVFGNITSNSTGHVIPVVSASYGYSPLPPPPPAPGEFSAIASGVPAPGGYTIAGVVKTRPGNSTVGGIIPGQSYVNAYGATANQSRPELTSFGCGFTLSNANLTVNNFQVSSITDTTATVTWTTNAPASSTATYAELGSGIDSTVTDPTLVTLHHLVLDGLSPFAFYNVEGTSNLPATGCLSVQATTPFASFQTPAIFPVTEQDSPYDSITHQGGGVEVSWQIPDFFFRNSNFDNGSVVFFPASHPSNATHIDIRNERVLLSFPGLYDTLGQNLTGLTPNTTYVVQVEVNMTLNQSRPGVFCNPCNFTASSEPTSFNYLLDSTGDGLADSEKTWGWPVTYVGLYGQPVYGFALGDPTAFASNGLTSDFTEKRFGLNPATLDTTGSGLLDLWNLTFDATGASLAGLSLWYENATNPFALPPAPNFPAPGAPIATQLSNLTDTSPGSSEVLWSPQALAYLQQLEARDHISSLRAVTGSYGRVPTLTVEGKLSFGANPVAVSTYGDGHADGARLSPLGPMDLQVSVTSWSVGGLTGGNGVAAFINSVSPVSGSTDLQNFSVSTFAPTGGSTSVFPDLSSEPYSQFTVTFPVDDTEQYALLNVSLEANVGVQGSPTYVRVLNAGPYHIDLLAPGQTQTFSGSGSGVSGTITLSWQPVRVFSKANTMLWVPSDGSTLSNLPAGLQRYTGEQSFDLLVVNDTAGSPISVPGVPTPDGTSTYTPYLNPGLNNILVPREGFLSSPLGQALLNGTSITPKVQSSPLVFNPSTWLARIDQNQTTAGSPSYISTYSSASQGCSGGSNCGGDPQNPFVESGNTALAVQAVFTLNITGVPDFSNLLAGLLLNSSGNLTGSVNDITAALPTLGLSRAVLTSLANSTLLNDGGYGAPTSKTPAPPPPPPPWWESVASSVWNTVSGVVAGLSVAWNAIVAAASYLAHAALELANALGITRLAAQFLKTLEYIASVMLKALEALLVFLKQAIEALLRPIVDGIAHAMGGYLSSLWHDLSPLWTAHNNSQSPPQSASFKFISDLLGGPLLIAFGIGVLAEIALVVINAIFPGSAVVEEVVEDLLVQTLISAFTFALTSLAPSIISLLGLITGAWFIYNATGGGQHGMLRPAQNPLLCSGIINAIFAGISVGTAVGVILATDAPEASYTLYLLQLFFRGGFGAIPILPALTLAFDAISLALALLTFPGGPIQGGEAHALNMIGLILGGIGLLLPIVVSRFLNPASKALIHAFDPVINLGYVLGAGGTTINLIQVAAGC